MRQLRACVFQIVGTVTDSLCAPSLAGRATRIPRWFDPSELVSQRACAWSYIARCIHVSASAKLCVCELPRYCHLIGDLMGFLAASLSLPSLSLSLSSLLLSRLVSSLFCSVLFCSVLFCSVLFCSVLFCSVLFCSVLFCSLFYFSFFPSLVRNVDSDPSLNSVTTKQQKMSQSRALGWLRLHCAFNNQGG